MPRPKTLDDQGGPAAAEGEEHRFRSGNKDHHSAARANLKRGINTAKADHRGRIGDHLESQAGVAGCPASDKLQD